MTILKNGQKFGKWTVLEYAGKDERSNHFYKCQCECGIIKNVKKSNLTSGHSKSCFKCARKRAATVKTVIPYIDGKPKSGINTKPRKNNKSLIGQKFSRLTILEDTGKRYYGYVVYKCQCDCGNIFEAPTHNIKAGQVKSCGCLLKEDQSTWGQRVKDNYKVWKKL